MTIDRRKLLFGIASFIPGFKGKKSLSTGGTNDARYCYSVWLRHMVIAYNKGLCRSIPETVAELGPGDSIGIGLAALLSGASRYVGLDAVQHASLERNLDVFDELVMLYKDRERIPSGAGFSDVKPYLDSYEFPSAIMNDDHLHKVLAQERIEKIRWSIQNVGHKDSCIRYIAPWFARDVIEHGSIDMIFSQAVMEYVPNYGQAYRSMRAWLKPQGFVSHQIDFRSHQTTDTWDGHWACSDLVWRLMRGKRSYFITRSVHSQHVAALKAAGFDVIVDQKIVLRSQTPSGRLNPRFRIFGPEDVTTAGALIQARRSDEAF